MKKEQKIISLKLAKELQKVAKEKGFKLPESEYYWIKIGIIPTVKNGGKDYKWELHKSTDSVDDYDGVWISAYDTAELGEILKNYELECIWFPEENKFGAFQTCSGINTLYAKTEANARGKMLIYLIKNNKIK